MLLVMLGSVVPTARAEEEAPGPLSQALGATLDAALSDEEWQALAAACPQEDPESVGECLGQSAEAQPILEAAGQRAVSMLVEAFGEAAVEEHGDALLGLSHEGMGTIDQACASTEDIVACIGETLAGGAVADEAASPEGGSPVDYPDEALALLPRELLDLLPKAVTAFLRPQDYQAFKEACPQEDLEQVVACLESHEELLDTLHTRAVIASLLTYMDQELPNRLVPEQLDALSENCESEGGAWADCVFEKGMDGDECYEVEDGLASCLVDDDRVTEAYLKIQADKKEVFGPEFYVQFRGLMSTMSLEDVEAMRGRCPQDEEDALFECLAEDEVVDAVFNVFVMISDALMEEAQGELADAGTSMTEAEAEEYHERVTGLLLTFPVRAIDSLAKDCIAQHPELETAKTPDDIGAMLTCIEEGSHTDPVANPAFISPERLRSWLGIAREKVIGALRVKEEEAQGRSFTMVLMILAAFGVVGSVVVLLMPLRLAKKYPGRESELWRASAIAAGTFLFTVALLGGALLVMRTVQGKVATESSSPKMVVANGVFDVLEKDEYIDQLSGMSRERLDFIKTPLRTVVEAATVDGDAQYMAFSAFVSEHWVDQLSEPELRPLAKNAQLLAGHVGSFKKMFGFYRRVDWIMGYVPIVLSVLAVLLYMIPLRETLVNIATAPARAAEGGSEGIAGRAMATVKAELKLVGPYLLIMTLYLVVSGALLSLAVEPLIELLMSYSFMTVMYILLTEASSFVLYASLGGAILLLVGCIAIYILAMVFFIGTVRKVLRARFHWGQPLSHYGKFWGIGTLATIGVLLFPVAFATVLRMIALDHLVPGVDVAGGNITAADMLIIPLGGILMLPVLLWLLQCIRAMGWVRKYPVVEDSVGDPEGSHA